MGNVYKAELTNNQFLQQVDQSTFVIKQTDNEDIFKAHLFALALAGHPFLEHIYFIFEEGDNYCIVSKYIPGNSFEYHEQSFNYYKNSRPQLKKEQIIHILAQLVLGLEGMHVNGISHNDIAARNILVDGDLNTKIIDYGLADNSEPSRSTDFTNLFNLFKPFLLEKSKSCITLMDDIIHHRSSSSFLEINQFGLEK
uniref:Serine/threonine-protein kinase greatwall n=1 Tax=Ditylenchus dipsaci TaxID=166011 RepID=A0A915DBJ1_9BILA